MKFAPPDLAALKRLGDLALSTDGGFDAPDDTEAEDPRERIGGYEILEEIGRGGMGVVYTARQTELDRIVALKVITTGASANIEAETRFRREAQVAGRLRHPNIVTVYESGRDAGCSYFSMDHVPGGDLAQAMRREMFPVRAAADLVRKIAEGVAHAHAAGVLHRDLKPSNILLDGQEPRIADFGLSTLVDPGGDLTVVSTVIGTPHYLAPEAFLRGSGALSAASDVYALGAILYELTTGRRPFAGANAAQLSQLVPLTDPPAPRLLNPLVPRDLETICLKCLAKEPGDRYATARELADDLARYLADEPIRAQPPSPLGRFVRWCRRRPALAAAWFLLAALAGVSIASTIAVGRERDAAIEARADAEAGRTRALAAEKRTEEQLWRAELARAQALTHSHRQGQRLDAVAALKNAARLRVTPELREAAIAALAQVDVRERRRWPVRAASGWHFAFAPDLLSYLTEPRPGELEWRDAADDRVRATLRCQPDFTERRSQVLFSPDGTRVLMREGDRSISVWSLAEARRLFQIPGRPAFYETHARLSADVAWHPDGTEIALRGPSGGLAIHSAADGRELRRWEHPSKAIAVHYSPDGRWLALLDWGAKEAIVLDAVSLAPRWTVSLPVAPCALTWRPDGSELALGLSDGRIRLVSAAQGALVREITGHRARIFALQYTPDGALMVSNSGDATTRVWDAHAGESRLVLPGLTGALELQLSADGRRLGTSGNDTDAVLLDLFTPSFVRQRPGRFADDIGGMVHALDFSADGTRLAVASWRCVDVLNPADGSLLWSTSVGAEAKEELSTALTSDGDAVFVGSDLGGLVRHPRQGEPQRILEPAKDLLIAAISPDRQRLVLTNRAEVKIISPDGAVIEHRPGLPEAWSAALSPDGRHLAVQCTGRGKSADTPARVYALGGGVVHEGTRGPLGMVQFSPDGRWFFASGQRGADLLRTTDWKPAAALPDPIAKSGTIASFSADGELLAVSVDEKVHLLHPATGAKRAALSSPSGNASTARPRLSPDGRRLAVLWDDASLDLWDLHALRRELAELGLDW